MSKTAIGGILLMFWAAVLIYIVALVWRRFAKRDADDEAVAARRRPNPDESKDHEPS